MALGSTEPLTEMSIRNLPGSKGRPACEADLPSVSQCGSLDITQPYGSPRAVTRIALPLKIMDRSIQGHETAPIALHK
jgi:hypothetical protein